MDGDPAAAGEAVVAVATGDVDAAQAGQFAEVELDGATGGEADAAGADQAVEEQGVGFQIERAAAGQAVAGEDRVERGVGQIRQLGTAGQTAVAEHGRLGLV